MITKNIETIEQRGQATCGQTCIAMVTGKTEQDIVELVGDGPTRDEHLAYALTYFNIAVQTDRVDLIWGFVYIATVPSLRHLGRMHYIVLDCREHGEMVIHDPSGAYDNDVLDEFGIASLMTLLPTPERTVSKNPDEWQEQRTRGAITALAEEL